MIDQFINWILNAGNAFFDFLSGIFGWFISGFRDAIQWIGDGINWILSGIWGFFSSVGTFISTILSFIGLVISTVIEVVEILIMIMGIVFDFMRVIAAWISQVVELVFATIQDFNAAQPLVLPGLPRCISAPLDHNACAVYYVVEHTLLADATPGEVIVPFITLIIDLWILFFVYKSVVGIGKLFQEIVKG